MPQWSLFSFTAERNITGNPQYRLSKAEKSHLFMKNLTFFNIIKYILQQQKNALNHGPQNCPHFVT